MWGGAFKGSHGAAWLAGASRCIFSCELKLDLSRLQTHATPAWPAPHLPGKLMRAVASDEAPLFPRSAGNLARAAAACLH